ncbi:hypothetical protein AUP68_05279 [Ilyonectria robusta]
MKLSIAFVLGVCGLGMAADLGSGLQKVKLGWLFAGRSLLHSTTHNSKLNVTSIHLAIPTSNDCDTTRIINKVSGTCDPSISL